MRVRKREGAHVKHEPEQVTIAWDDDFITSKWHSPEWWKPQGVPREWVAAAHWRWTSPNAEVKVYGCSCALCSHPNNGSTWNREAKSRDKFKATDYEGQGSTITKVKRTCGTEGCNWLAVCTQWSKSETGWPPVSVYYLPGFTKIRLFILPDHLHMKQCYVKSPFITWKLNHRG